MKFRNLQFNLFSLFFTQSDESTLYRGFVGVLQIYFMVDIFRGFLRVLVEEALVSPSVNSKPAMHILAKIALPAKLRPERATLPQ